MHADVNECHEVFARTSIQLQNQTDVLRSAVLLISTNTLACVAGGFFLSERVRVRQSRENEQ